MDILSIILGWLLGMLSPVIVNRIYRHYKKNDLYGGLSKEINHITERLIVTLQLLSNRTGSFDRDLVTWLLEHYEKIETKNPQTLKVYRMFVKASDDELNEIKRSYATSSGSGLSLQKFPLLFINMHLSDFSLFSPELQAEIFELKSRIEILNSGIASSEKYFFMTFDSSISTESQLIIKTDLTNKYIQVETMIKRAVEQIETVNSVKKI
ncbi:hypothetical protein [Pseudoalteromonas prydzensis]|uniref:hypothetical protein n=1 Tax=Pseudoalteromonas prydzensis TaxID=182141 RepID=UPI003FD69E81